MPSLYNSVTQCMQQISDDLRELKYIGELEYNFDNMISGIRAERGKQFAQQLAQIDQVINQDRQVYERQEMTRKILYQEVNRLKTRCKLEVDSRKRADEEIEGALNKYQELISREVESKRQDIKARTGGFKAINSDQ